MCALRDFRKLDAGAGDFVYFDPPYQPLDKPPRSRRYAKDDFGAQEQEALRDLCLALDKRGAKFMLSNSDTSTPLYSRIRRSRSRSSKRRVLSIPKRINAGP